MASLLSTAVSDWRLISCMESIYHLARCYSVSGSNVQWQRGEISIKEVEKKLEVVLVRPTPQSVDLNYWETWTSEGCSTQNKLPQVETEPTRSALLQLHSVMGACGMSLMSLD